MRRSPNAQLLGGLTTAFALLMLPPLAGAGAADPATAPTPPALANSNPPTTPDLLAAPNPLADPEPLADPADGTPAGAVAWFEQQSGDASYEGLCEMAAENAYGTTGVWPSAIEHWEGARSAGKAHEGDTDPPEGAFVYWNTSENGHVGIADGSGGFHSSSIDGALGHADDLSYFDNYLGWSEPQVPA